METAPIAKMSKTIPATVGMLTFNSGKVLQRALESVREFDDILLCDGGSTDDTLEIARAFGARVISQDQQFKNSDGTLKDFGGVRQQLIVSAKHDWFLYIDSDETISDGLREDIRQIVAQSPDTEHSDGMHSYVNASVPLVYRVPIGILLDGSYIQHSTNYPGYQYRFFNRRSDAHFIKPVHERIVFDTTLVGIGTLSHPWYVHSSRVEWDHYLQETAHYRHMESLRYAAQPWGVYFTITFIKTLRISLGTFVRASWIYIRYGNRSTLPLRGEFGRAVAPLMLIVGVCARKLGWSL